MAQRHASKGSGLLSLVLALVLILAGLAVLLYPRVTNLVYEQEVNRDSV